MGETRGGPAEDTYRFQSFSVTSAVSPMTSWEDLSNTGNAMDCSQFTDCRNSVQVHCFHLFAICSSPQIIFLHLSYPISTWTRGWSFSSFSCYLLKMNAGQPCIKFMAAEQNYTWKHTWHRLQRTWTLWVWSTAWYHWPFLLFVRGRSTKNGVFCRYLVNSCVSKWHKTLCEPVTTLVRSPCNSCTPFALAPYSPTQKVTKSETSKDRRAHWFLVIVSKTMYEHSPNIAQECSLLMPRSGWHPRQMETCIHRLLGLFEGIKY